MTPTREHVGWAVWWLLTAAWLAIVVWLALASC